MQKDLFKYVGVSVAVGAAALAFAEEEMTAAPLNVVLVLVDDLGWSDLGQNGNALIETPVLDRMSAESARFANFYVHPVCAPTRASLLTGRHYLRTGVTHVHGGGDFLHPDEVTMGQWFQENGYVTGMWGKWHSGKTSGYYPWERGFDEAYMAKLYRHQDGEGLFLGKSRSTPGWTTDVLTDMTIDFIERHQHEPFFAFLSHLAPHRPLHAKQELIDKYISRGLGEKMATAFAMVEMVDESVGRIREKLDELNLSERTVLLFLSDNGPQFYGDESCSPEDYQKRNPSGLKGFKGSMWENGIKVPLLVYCPSRIPAHSVDHLVDVHDILPTLIDLCGFDRTPDGALPMDGRSVTAYLKDSGNLPPKRSFIFSNIGWPPIKAPEDSERIAEQEYAPVPPEEKSMLPWEPQLMGLRTEEFKLLRNPGYVEGAPALCGKEVLINLKDDPLENINLAAVDEARAASMRVQLEQWFEEVCREEHSFHAPRFEIGPETSGVVYLYAMRRRLGHAVNYVFHASGWKEPGDGGEYSIHVTTSGRYQVRVKTRQDKLTGELPLTLSFDGRRICSGLISSASFLLGAADLEQGDHLLTVTRDSGGTPEGDGELVGLYFEIIE